MPRKARITVPGAVHHIMSRGHEGRNIFLDDDDYYTFLKILEKCIQETDYQLYAWALLSNHYHIVIRINQNPLGSFMRHLNGIYAQYFRKKIGKKGSIYQDRYKSIVTHDQNYVEELIRYVHTNPIRAGLCTNMKTLDTYRWCGHSVLMGNCTYTIQNTKDVLLRYSNSRQKYKNFIKEGLKKDSNFIDQIRKSNTGEENIRNSGCWVIGNREFVQKALQNANDVRILRAYQNNKSEILEEVVKKVCSIFSIPKDSIMNRSRNSKISEGRKMIAWIACRENNIPVSEIAQYFNINPSSVSRMIAPGKELFEHYNLKQ